ncbi:MAG: hypothetical protein WBQ72_13390 [Terriglobales bacterium]
MSSEVSPVAHRGAAHRSRHLAVWIFAAFQFFYLLTSTGRVRTPDEYNTLYTTESLALHGTTAVPQAVALHNFYGRFDVRGRPRAAYPPGQAIACVPWYLFGQYVLARLPGVPADDTDLVVAFATCLGSATFAALTVTFFFLLLVGSGIPPRAALLATFMVGLATPMFAYSGWLFSEPLSAAIFTGVAWALFARGVETRDEVGSREFVASSHAEFSGPIPLRTAAIGGLILGLAVLVRPTNVLVVAVFALAIFARDGRAALRAIVVFGAAAAVGVVILLAHNAVLFGSPLAFGYPAAAEGAKQLNRFDTPLLTGLYGFLFSPGKSVFIFAPPVTLALAGMGGLWRRNRALAALAVLLPLVGLLFFAKYSQWEGGYCVGPRYLVPALVFLCLGLGPVLANGGTKVKALARALLGIGFVVQALSLATSFMEDQAPAGRYYAANWTYRMDYSLRGPVQLFWKYLGNPQPARLGLGWDRWFVFLAKGGVSRATLAVFGAAMAAGMAISLLGLAKTASEAASGEVN